MTAIPLRETVAAVLAQCMDRDTDEAMKAGIRGVAAFAIDHCGLSVRRHFLDAAELQFEEEVTSRRGDQPEADGALAGLRFEMNVSQMLDRVEVRLDADEVARRTMSSLASFVQKTGVADRAKFLDLAGVMYDDAESERASR